MAKQAVYQVRMDEEIKDQVEALYRSLGTTFAEAVRIFAVQSIREHGMPFTPSEVRGKAFGALSAYANPALMSEEAAAFEKSMEEKHTNATYLSCLEKDMYNTERTKELRKEIEKSMPRELFMQIEPLLNELVDLSMERAFLAGAKQCEE